MGDHQTTTVGSATPDLTEEQRIQIRRVLGNMPYLPLVTYSPGVATFNEFLSVLSDFAVALRKVAAENETNREELRRLKADQAAFRRVLGTADLADLTNRDTHDERQS